MSNIYDDYNYDEDEEEYDERDLRDAYAPSLLKGRNLHQFDVKRSLIDPLDYDYYYGDDDLRGWDDFYEH